jgi:hypothetical protein
MRKMKKVRKAVVGAMAAVLTGGSGSVMATGVDEDLLQMLQNGEISGEEFSELVGNSKANTPSKKAKKKAKKKVSKRVAKR